MIGVIVLSTTGVSISKHFCNGKIKDIALFHQADPCEHNNTSNAIQCPIHDDMVIYLNDKNRDCCTNTTELIKDEYPQINVKPFEIPDLQLVILYLIHHLFIDELNYNVSKLNLHFLHLPPLIGQEITILVQSFLL